MTNLNPRTSKMIKASSDSNAIENCHAISPDIPSRIVNPSKNLEKWSAMLA